ncbi:MAG: hypothetical protein KDA75_21335 [Planctomycetaceae bacterium]|nr:hypothetical protein [Planctomycetaceae bacterium]
MSETTLLIAIAAGLGIALLLLSVVVAYREGKRIGAATRSERFNRLPTELRLHSTEWDIRFTEFGAQGTQEHRGRMWFRQYDSRVIGQGEDALGHSWTAEGVIFQDKLCLVILDTDGSGRSLGAVMVDEREGGRRLDGMRCVWSASQNAVIVQPIQFRRCDSADRRMERSSETSGVAEPSEKAVRIGDTC